MSALVVWECPRNTTVVSKPPAHYRKLNPLKNVNLKATMHIVADEIVDGYHLVIAKGGPGSLGDMPTRYAIWHDGSAEPYRPGEILNVALTGMAFVQRGGGLRGDQPGSLMELQVI